MINVETWPYFQEAMNLVTVILGEEKATLWMEAHNPLLGGIRPREMIQIGRGHKLLEFIHGCMKENGPDERPSLHNVDGRVS